MNQLLGLLCLLFVSAALAEDTDVANKAESRLYFQGDNFTINLIPVAIFLKILFVIAYLISYYYGEEESDYGYVSSGYDAPSSSYDAPATGYGAPSSSYDAPAPSYHAPAPSYSAPAPSYSAPAPSYSAPSSSYAAPHSTVARRKGLNAAAGFVHNAVARVSEWANSQ